MQNTALRYRFGDFVLDVGQQRLSRTDAGDPVPLTGKTYDALKYLVERAGEPLSKDQLLQALWPAVIVEENSLSQVISGLRQLLGESPGENRYIATLPRKGYRFVAPVTVVTGGEIATAVAALPPATSATLATQTATPPAGIAAPSRTRFVPARLAAAAIVLIAVIAGGTYWRLSQVDPIQSLAILPFKPLVAAERDESLELGMTDSLIGQIGQRSGRQIAPLSSVRRLGGPDQDPIDAGKRLHVDAVLDGSLQRSGDRLRVNARLLRIRDGKQLWSQTFDETFTGIFDVQDKIAARIATAMSVQPAPLNIRSLHGTEDAEAYSLYASGRFAYYRLTAPSLQQCIDAYQQAIVRDPRYALAYAGLADCYSLLGVLGARDPRIVFPQARAAFDKALQIDPQLAAAYVARGQYRMIYDRDPRSALDDLNRATALDPGYAPAYFYRGIIYGARGEFERAQAEFDHAQGLEPYVLARPAAAALQLLYARQYDEGIRRLRQLLELDDRFDLARGFLIRMYLAKGDGTAALDTLRGHEDMHAQGSYGFLAAALAIQGHAAAARIEVERVVALSRQRFIPAADLVLAYAALGDADATLHWLEAAYEDRSVLMDAMQREPLLDFLHADPRFIALLHRAAQGSFQSSPN